MRNLRRRIVRLETIERAKLPWVMPERLKRLLEYIGAEIEAGRKMMRDRDSLRTRADVP